MPGAARGACSPHQHTYTHTAALGLTNAGDVAHPSPRSLTHASPLGPNADGCLLQTPRVSVSRANLCGSSHGSSRRGSWVLGPGPCRGPEASAVPSSLPLPLHTQGMAAAWPAAPGSAPQDVWQPLTTTGRPSVRMHAQAPHGTQPHPRPTAASPPIPGPRQHLLPSHGSRGFKRYQTQTSRQNQCGCHF